MCVCDIGDLGDKVVGDWDENCRAKEQQMSDLDIEEKKKCTNTII
jgi:hypothetical protein